MRTCSAGSSVARSRRPCALERQLAPGKGADPTQLGRPDHGHRLPNRPNKRCLFCKKATAAGTRQLHETEHLPARTATNVVRKASDLQVDHEHERPPGWSRPSAASGARSPEQRRWRTDASLDVGKPPLRGGAIPASADNPRDVRFERPLRQLSRRSPVIRWNVRFIRIAIALGAFASLAIASGAGARWS
jgi:hypothetical protein